MPWLLAEPQARLADWRQRYHFMVRELEQSAARADAALGRDGLLASTRRRLAARRDGLREQTQCVAALLAPLRLDQPVARYETHLALRTRLPPAQDLHSYYSNLHRDWVWGAAENAANRQFAEELLEGLAPRRLLIPGAGAGRLAWDLHEVLRAELTAAIDINPLLLLAAAAVVRGDGATLMEFPIAPRSADDGAVRRRLPGMPGGRPGLQLAFADVGRLPFRKGAYDTVLTPWLVDIVEQPFAALAAQINAALAVGGHWASFGSLAFGSPDPALHHDPAEVIEILAQQGFEVQRTHEGDVPYMRAPGSRHSRIETIWGFAAVKVREAAMSDPDVLLPEWLVDARLPVPALEHFRTQALATRVYAFVTALIDGQRGMGEIAAFLVEQKLMRAEEAVPAVRSFLLSLYEESLRGSAGPA